MMARAGIALFLLLMLAACAGREARLDTAAAIARQGGLQPDTVPSRPFTLAAFARNSDPTAPVTLYIEGDGLAWISRSQPSSDPTPRDPMGLRLAALDASPNVVYLARPCQYVWSPLCSDIYWTDQRFSEEVVEAMSAAIDRLILPEQKIHLVGYSGGGAVAVLVAARRHDVVSLRTVAGNLDHAEVNRIHRVSPMNGSLNAADMASALVSLPQLHLVGGQDDVVPPVIAESYARHAGDQRCIMIRIIPGATHTSGWIDIWPTVVRQIPVCR